MSILNRNSKGRKGEEKSRNNNNFVTCAAGIEYQLNIYCKNILLWNSKNNSWKILFDIPSFKPI